MKIEIGVLAFATSVAILAAAPYASAQQTTFRDSRGSTIGTATTLGNQTTYRDNRGSTVGTSTGARR